MSNSRLKTEVEIGISTPGLEYVENLRQAMDATGDSIIKASKEAANGTMTFEEYSSVIVKMTAQLDQLVKRYNEATGATERLRKANDDLKQSKKDAESADESENRRYREALKNSGAAKDAIFGEIDALKRKKLSTDELLETIMKSIERKRQDAEASKRNIEINKELADSEKRLARETKDALDAQARAEADAIKSKERLRKASLDLNGASMDLAKAQGVVDAAMMGLDLAKQSGDLERIRLANIDLTQSVKSLGDAENTYNQIKNRGNESLDQSSQKMAAWTRTAYFSAQAAEDFQYGFGAILNNLPLIAMEATRAMDGNINKAMGWATAVSMAGIAINQFVIPAVYKFIDSSPKLKEAIDDISSRLNPFHVEAYTDKFEKLEEQIKKLQGNKVRIPIEDAALDAALEKSQKLRDNLAAYDAMANGQNKYEKAAGEAAKRFVTESADGEENLRNQVQNKLVVESESRDPIMRKLRASQRDLEKKFNAAPGPLERGMIDKEQAEVNSKILARQREIDTESKATTGDLFSAAFSGKDKTKTARLAGLLGNAAGNTSENDNAGGPDTVAGQLLRNDAGYMKEVDEREKQAPILAEAVKDRKAAGEVQERASAARKKFGNAFLEAKANVAKRGVDKIISKYSAKMKGYISLQIANFIKQGEKKEDIRDVLILDVSMRMQGEGVDQATADEAAKKLVDDEMLRFDSAVAVGDGDESTVAQGIIDDAGKRDALAATTKANKDEARLGEAGNKFMNEDMVGSAMISADMNSTMFNSANKSQQALMRQQASFGFSQDASMLKANISGFRPKNAAEKELLASEKDRLEYLKAKAKNPFPTVDEEKANIVEMNARKMVRGGATDKDGKVLSIEDARKAASINADKVQRDVNSKVMSNMGATLDRQGAMMNLQSEFMSRLIRAEESGRRLDAQLNEIQGRARRPRQGGAPRTTS